MSTTTIHSVERFPLAYEKLSGCFIDFPVPGTARDEYNFDCAGWVLGKESCAVGIEILANDGPVRRIPITLPRPDVYRHYPGLPQPRAAGFWSPVSVIGMTEDFELIVQAVLQNLSRVPIGRIRGSHRPVPSGFRPTIQPLLVTSMGRTGTTWIMRLLSEHPGIVAYRPYPCEMRAAKYWIQFLSTLTEPAAHAQSSSKLVNFDTLWWVAHHPFSKASRSSDPLLQEWFGRRFVDRAATLCQQSIEECYREVAALQNQTNPVYFAEKHLADETPGIFWELYPGTREIFLVRDFRDMLCSIRAFNNKRGSLGFGRDRANNEQEYILYLREEALRLLGSWKSRRDRACLVRYEDLVLRPMETLKRVLEYLGLSSSDTQINEMIQGALGTPELREHRTTANPQESVERWRRDLDSPSQQFCEEAFGNVLRDFGYSCGEALVENSK